MIALFLATQLSAQVAPPPSNFIAPKEIIRTMPARQACMGAPGHFEVSLKTTPAALYRKGDRPAKGYARWADYPDGVLCAVETGR